MDGGLKKGRGDIASTSKGSHVMGRREGHREVGRAGGREVCRIGVQA